MLYWDKTYYDTSIDNYKYSLDKMVMAYLPKEDGSYHNTPHLSGDYETWSTGALSDFHGKENTIIIVDGAEDSRDMCNVLNSFNQIEQTAGRFGDWYVPACGQLALVYLNITKINIALDKINGQKIDITQSYWTSTESSNIKAWEIDFSSGTVSSFRDKTGCISVRFVRDI